MKRGAALAGGLVLAAGVVLLLGLTSSSGSPNSKPEFSPALRPPMLGRRRYMVTFSLPEFLSQDEAAKALEAGVAKWGELLAPLQFAPDLAGKLTAVVSARTLQSLPLGPPMVLTTHGPLEALVWAELPGGIA